MEPAEVDGVVIGRMVIHTVDVLAPVERVQHLEGRVVGRGSVGIKGGDLDHGGINPHYRLAIRRHQAAAARFLFGMGVVEFGKWMVVVVRSEKSPPISASV